MQRTPISVLQNGSDLVTTKNHVTVTHHVKPARDVALPQHWKDWMSNTPCKVNSYHNFMFVCTTGFFCPIMVSEDGCVEAMESAAGAPRMIGIMWHPERSLPKCGESENLEYRNANKDLIRTLFRLDKTVPTRAVVLCAGQGTRLRPLTNTVPKCMVKFQGHCIIDYILGSLRACGVDDICLVKGYLADVLMRDGVRYAVNSDFEKQTW